MHISVISDKTDDRLSHGLVTSVTVSQRCKVHFDLLSELVHAGLQALISRPPKYVSKATGIRSKQ